MGSNQTSKMTFGLQNGTNHNVFWYETRPYDHSLDSANARKEFLKVDLNDWTTQVSFLSLFLSLSLFLKSFQQLTLSLFRSHTFLESLFLSVSLPFCVGLYFCCSWNSTYLSLSLTHTHKHIKRSYCHF